ncbi:MAG: hypoxanthine phosphoribosyltransferase [Prevotella sp.]|jgi:hypoxanthine phosphoribosyltransferase|nr:hypoxanthine phosphoribosyltransferase [Prevotella sp.]
MSIVKIKDKTFKTSITQEEIQQRIKSLAARINEDMAGKNPLFLSVLNGSFMFTADLLRQVTIPCEVSFVKLASYDGVLSTGKIKEVIGLNDDITGRTVVIVEDIVDTGRTMRKMLNSLTVRHPKEIHICTLFVKPEKLEEPLDIEYAAFSIPNDFIVGYGLDYDQQGRNLNEIYTLVE